MDYLKMTQHELECERIDLIQVRENFTIETNSMREDEIKDRIEMIDEQLKKFD